MVLAVSTVAIVVLGVLLMRLASRIPSSGRRTDYRDGDDTGVFMGDPRSSDPTDDAND